MGKRSNEAQISKDDYDVDQPSETYNPGYGMKRASAENLKKRRIVKVSRSKFRAAAGSSSSTAPSAVPSAAPSAPSPAKPFNDSGSKAASQPLSTTPAKPANPFANVVLAPAGAPKPLTSFAPAASAAPAVPTAPAATAMTTSSKRRKLNEKFFEAVQQHRKLCPADDWSSVFRAYLKFSCKIEDDPTETTSPTSDSPAADAPQAPSAPPATKPSTKTSSKPFSFGATPAPASKPFTSFAFGASASAPVPSGAFSFGSSAPAPNATFVFGASTASSSNATPAATSAVTSEDDGPTQNPDDGKIEEVEHEDNKDEDVLLEVRAKPMKYSKKTKGWKKFSAGVLRLYRHKLHPEKQKMVLRNQIGKVQLNLAIVKGMVFTKVVNTKKGVAAFVRFMAVENSDTGMESFMLQTKPGDVDKLLAKLKDMAQ